MNEQTAVIFTLEKEAFLRQLDAKLLEGTDEYMQSGEIDELADILEVVCAIAGNKSLTADGFDKIRVAKKRNAAALKKGCSL